MPIRMKLCRIVIDPNEYLQLYIITRIMESNSKFSISEHLGDADLDIASNLNA